MRNSAHFFVFKMEVCRCKCIAVAGNELAMLLNSTFDKLFNSVVNNNNKKQPLCNGKQPCYAKECGMLILTATLRQQGSMCALLTRVAFCPLKISLSKMPQRGGRCNVWAGERQRRPLNVQMLSVLALCCNLLPVGALNWTLGSVESAQHKHTSTSSEPIFYVGMLSRVSLSCITNSGFILFFILFYFYFTSLYCNVLVEATWKVASLTAKHWQHC